jgi:hypothetical protein
MDRYGRTPLHFALSNAGRKAAPAAVRLLLTLRREIVNATDGGPLPLKVLAEYAASVRTADKTQRESVLRCLEHLLSFNPDPTADFFTALQSLPDWLQERAVVMPNVQILLNIKIAQRFPTGVLLSDFFVQVVVLACYGIAIPQAIDRSYTKDYPDTSDPEDIDASLEHWPFFLNLVVLYLGAAYFLLRTIIQILSLVAMGAFHVWVKNSSNWLDLAYIFTVFFWAAEMDQEGNIRMEMDNFRTGTTISCVFLWTKLLAYLRNTYIDFAVFLGGLFYVVRRLVAFLMCLCIILIAFSQMFFTVYRRSEICPTPVTDDLSDEDRYGYLVCENLELAVYCTRWSAFLNTFTMLIGKFSLLIWSGSWSIASSVPFANVPHRECRRRTIFGKWIRCFLVCPFYVLGGHPSCQCIDCDCNGFL